MNSISDSCLAVSNPEEQCVFRVYKTFLSEKQIFDKKCFKKINLNENRIKDGFFRQKEDVIFSVLTSLRRYPERFFSEITIK